MRNKISAIIVSKKHIVADNIICNGDFEEKNFELCILDDTKDIVSGLNKFKGFDAIITIGDDLDLSMLNDLSIDVRKKWSHFSDLKTEEIGKVIVDIFTGNISRHDYNVKTFSIFVSCYNTDPYKLERLYKSLCAQTYTNWNLWLLDDSENGNNNVRDFVDKQNDYRIHLFKNHTHHANIGFNKHMIAMMCDGDYLMEMDHDDYLLPDCLELFDRAFATTGSDFVYSYVLELINDKPVLYGEQWGFGGYGKIGTFNFNGKKTEFAVTPDINAATIRTIYTQPNHPRCWKKDFYHKIGGHNTDLSVLDDQEILIRTFLNGKMCKIPKVLYIQDEGSTERGDGSGSTAQSKRFNEIQRTTWYIKSVYDRKIHERVLDLGHKDPYWVENVGGSDLTLDCDKLPPINDIYIIE